LNGSDDKSDPDLDLGPEPSPAWSDEVVQDIFRTVPDIPGPAVSDAEEDEEEEDDFDDDESGEEEVDDGEDWSMYDRGVSTRKSGFRGRKKTVRDTEHSSLLMAARTA
jgi:hypothetical protein